MQNAPEYGYHWRHRKVFSYDRSPLKQWFHNWGSKGFYFWLLVLYTKLFFNSPLGHSFLGVSWRANYISSALNVVILPNSNWYKKYWSTFFHLGQDVEYHVSNIMLDTTHCTAEHFNVVRMPCSTSSVFYGCLVTIQYVWDNSVTHLLHRWAQIGILLIVYFKSAVIRWMILNMNQEHFKLHLKIFQKWHFSITTFFPQKYSHDMGVNYCIHMWQRAVRILHRLLKFKKDMPVRKILKQWKMSKWHPTVILTNWFLIAGSQCSLVNSMALYAHNLNKGIISTLRRKIRRLQPRIESTLHNA